MERPVITSPRYSNLNSNDALREYQRDVTLYEQAEEIKKLSNKENSVVVNVDSSVNEDYVESIQEHNDLLRTQMILQNLSKKDRSKYIKKLQEQEEQKEFEKEYIRKLRTINRKGKKLNDIVTDFVMQIEEATADNELNLVRQRYNSQVSTKGFWDIFAVWFFVLIIGGVFILALQSSIPTIVNILYGIFLIIYPIIASIKSKDKNNTTKELNNSVEKAKERYLIDVIDFIDFDCDIETKLQQYKDYCIGIVEDMQDKYKKHKKDFDKDFDEYIFEDTIAELEEVE